MAQEFQEVSDPLLLLPERTLLEYSLQFPVKLVNVIIWQMEK